jgi:hypothetical protein
LVDVCMQERQRNIERERGRSHKRAMRCRYVESK